MLRPVYLLLFRLFGWKIVGFIPKELKKYIIAVGPHTSNWDALYARLALKALGVHVRITIKDSYMKLPFGPFVRAMGGIGIDRRPKHEGEPRPSMVQLMSDLFKEHPKLVMLVTPDRPTALAASRDSINNRALSTANAEYVVLPRTLMPESG